MELRLFPHRYLKPVQVQRPEAGYRSGRFALEPSLLSHGAAYRRAVQPLLQKLSKPF